MPRRRSVDQDLQRVLIDMPTSSPHSSGDESSSSFITTRSTPASQANLSALMFAGHTQKATPKATPTSDHRPARKRLVDGKETPSLASLGGSGSGPPSEVDVVFPNDDDLKKQQKPRGSAMRSWKLLVSYVLSPVLLLSRMVITPILLFLMPNDRPAQRFPADKQSCWKRSCDRLRCKRKAEPKPHSMSIYTLDPEGGTGPADDDEAKKSGSWYQRYRLLIRRLGPAQRRRLGVAAAATLLLMSVLVLGRARSGSSTPEDLAPGAGQLPTADARLRDSMAAAHEAARKGALLADEDGGERPHNRLKTPFERLRDALARIFVPSWLKHASGWETEIVWESEDEDFVSSLLLGVYQRESKARSRSSRMDALAASMTLTPQMKDAPMSASELQEHLNLQPSHLEFLVGSEILERLRNFRKARFRRLQEFEAGMVKFMEDLRQIVRFEGKLNAVYRNEANNPSRILLQASQVTGDPLMRVLRATDEVLDPAMRDRPLDKLNQRAGLLQAVLDHLAEKTTADYHWGQLTDEEEFPDHYKSCQNDTAHPDCQKAGDEIGFTLVMQLSWDRSWMLDPICQRWRSPVAVAVYVPAGDEHLFDPAEVAQECRANGMRMHIFRDDRGGPAMFPVNQLRNAALNLVRTTHFLYSDVDHWPMDGLAEQLHEVARANPKVFASRYDSLVVPTFEHADQSACDEHVGTPELQRCLEAEAATTTPLTFEEIRDCYDDQRCQMYHKHFPFSHTSTDYEKVFETQANDIRMLECIESERYEPYLVMRYSAVVPYFDERFVGYGLNKIQWLWTLRMLGFRWGVAPQSFLFHVKHAKSRARNLFRGPEHQKRGTKSDHNHLVYAYAGSLLRAYDASHVPATVRVPLCDDPDTIPRESLQTASVAGKVQEAIALLEEMDGKLSSGDDRPPGLLSARETAGEGAPAHPLPLPLPPAQVDAPGDGDGEPVGGTANEVREGEGAAGSTHQAEASHPAAADGSVGMRQEGGAREEPAGNSGDSGQSAGEVVAKEPPLAPGAEPPFAPGAAEDRGPLEPPPPVQELEKSPAQRATARPTAKPTHRPTSRPTKSPTAKEVARAADAQAPPGELAASESESEPEVIDLGDCADPYSEGPIGGTPRNLHIVWTSMQQDKNARGIGGKEATARMRLLQLKALTGPSLMREFCDGTRFVWLIYYDQRTRTKTPADVLDELIAYAKGIEFAAALPAVTMGNGQQQRYSFSGNTGGSQHTKQLRAGISQGMFDHLQERISSDTFKGARTVTITNLKAGDALPLGYLKDVQSRIHKWEKKVKVSGWPPAVSGLSPEEWPDPDAPDGTAQDPALLLCTWHTIKWHPAAKGEAGAGRAGRVVTSRRCEESGLTVHMRKSDKISRISKAALKPKGAEKLSWYLGMSVDFFDKEIIAVADDQPLPKSGTETPFPAFLNTFHANREILEKASVFIGENSQAIEKENY